MRGNHASLRLCCHINPSLDYIWYICLGCSEKIIKKLMRITDTSLCNKLKEKDVRNIKKSKKLYACTSFL